MRKIVTIGFTALLVFYGSVYCGPERAAAAKGGAAAVIEVNNPYGGSDHYPRIAADVIASYTRDGIIDFGGLACMLQAEDNAVLASEVLRKMVKVETVKGPRHAARTNINTMNVASLVKQVSNPQFLKKIQECLGKQPERSVNAISRVTDPLGINKTVSFLIHSKLFALNTVRHDEQ